MTYSEHELEFTFAKKGRQLLGEEDARQRKSWLRLWPDCRHRTTPAGRTISARVSRPLCRRAMCLRKPKI